MGVKAKIIGATLSASTLVGGGIFMVHEYQDYQPNDIIHVSESCTINQSVGGVACHSVMTPGYNRVVDSMDQRALLMGTPLVMCLAGIYGAFAVSGIVRSRRYY